MVLHALSIVVCFPLNVNWQRDNPSQQLTLKYITFKPSYCSKLKQTSDFQLLTSEDDFKCQLWVKNSFLHLCTESWFGFGSAARLYRGKKTVIMTWTASMTTTSLMLSHYGVDFKDKYKDVFEHVILTLNIQMSKHPPKRFISRTYCNPSSAIRSNSSTCRLKCFITGRLSTSDRRMKSSLRSHPFPSRFLCGS